MVHIPNLGDVKRLMDEGMGEVMGELGRLGQGLGRIVELLEGILAELESARVHGGER